MNIDIFGRYKGGLPNKKNGLVRGSALMAPGFYHDNMPMESNDVPDYQSVDAQKAESFKDFHQDEREFRTAKWTWFRARVLLFQ